ncbi:MAG: putative Na+-dependent transporter, partial [Gemmataceae bacterium]|nr:putative Na+-dependent transporter [Gemmataceae bacterium]
MGDKRSPIPAAARFVHGHLGWLLIGSYAVAALWPDPGLWLRSVSLGRPAPAGENVDLSLPGILLGFLMLNAGLGVRLGQAKGVLGRPLLLGTGLAANLVVPLAFTAGVALVFCWWPDAEEYRNLLVGLALIA